ncbi:MAG: phosphoribosylformylglycinamidine synthase subunit PurL [Anaerolineales bacterium]|nr:phosphoribosylformylglycinamidine synthase subunit PurL [Anaerolineales bacterium]
MPVYKFIIQFTHHNPKSTYYLNEAHALGFHALRKIHVQDLYFIEGQLSQDNCKQLALKLLTDPVTQSALWMETSTPPSPPQPDTVILEVSLRPGVTDPVAEQIVRAAHELGFDGVQRAATGQRFILNFNEANNESAFANKLAKQLLANPVIQHWTIGDITPSFPQETESSGAVEIIPIRNLSEAELLTLSKDRRSALDLAEMKAIQEYYCKEQRDPTDVEFETIAQTWSEHCGHKTFKAKVDVESSSGNYQIDSIIKTYLKSATDKINAPWVISAFVDNAGIIDFDDEFEVSFKAETHNHPSAIEPFGGANTGVGGVIRDVLGVSAKPIANTDILCFGPQDMNPDTLPEGVLHPRRIQSGVVAGVQDYGNKIGIPTVNGAILYDEGYTANPLVFCGCVGLAPKGKHVRTPLKGDRVIVLGGRTGRDGLRGATFSSMTMDAQTGEVAGASVQIGDPITEKGLIDVITRARDLGLYNAITDCGAGGLSSAAGEMASTIGADIELAQVRLKYAGLAPWEIWLSEAQERMVLAVSSENISALQKLCDTFNTELTDIGEFTGTTRLVVRYKDQIVLDLENEFLHEGIPQRQLRAVISDQLSVSSEQLLASNDLVDVKENLLKLLSSPNIASKSHVIRIYDHEVQGGTVVKPLTGVEADAPSDAAVIKPIGTKRMKGIVLSNGINPEYGKRDAYKMAWSVIDESIRNAVAVGADPDRIAILDNFCWGDPLRPETMGSLVEACRGCHDAALFYGTPFISGKDSLNNEYLGADGQRHAIPPTLLISAIGIIHDVNTAVTMDLKAAGNIVYLLGGLELSSISRQLVPDVHKQTPQIYRALHQAIQNGLVKSCHDLSEGGLAVAAAEMCIGGRLGMELQFEEAVLFIEVNGCLLVEVALENVSEFENQFAELPFNKIGIVTTDQSLKLGNEEISVEELVRAFNTYNL